VRDADAVGQRLHRVVAVPGLELRLGEELIKLADVRVQRDRALE
jgi:hypothetical protein